MKKIIFFIPLVALLISCCNEPVYYNSDNNYSKALDTLKKYDDYILGDFDGKFLISTNVFTKGYAASIISNPIDSSYIQFSIGYKLKENNMEETAFVSYRLLESKTKLNTSNHYRYKYFSDFVDFFDRKTLVYFQPHISNENEHNIWICYQNFYDIDNDVYSYNSYKYDKKIKPENFNFIIDSINAIENPIKKVEVYYSFKCIGVNFYGDQIVMKNGKGKSTFEY